MDTTQTDLRSRLRGRIDGLKSSGIARVHDVQRGARGQVAKVQGSMRGKPMLWAGIAAGTGFGLGLFGRFIHWRNHRRLTPQLVIIETC